MGDASTFWVVAPQVCTADGYWRGTRTAATALYHDTILKGHMCRLNHHQQHTCSLPQSNWIRRRSGKNSCVRSRAVCSRLECAYQACKGRAAQRVCALCCCTRMLEPQQHAACSWSHCNLRCRLENSQVHSPTSLLAWVSVCARFAAAFTRLVSGWLHHSSGGTARACMCGEG